MLIVDGLNQIVDNLSDAQLEFIPVDAVVGSQRLHLLDPHGLIHLRFDRLSSLTLRVEVVRQLAILDQDRPGLSRIRIHRLIVNGQWRWNVSRVYII